VWIGITAGGTIAILIFFLSSMKQLVDFATTLSFLTTPVIAWLNYRVIFKGDISLEFIPSKKMKLLSQAGLLFLLGFTVFFLVARLFI
jgi:Mn2+/Fe2+ NRAMP family transporter